jgi:hypothetical protein
MHQRTVFRNGRPRTAIVQTLCVWTARFFPSESIAESKHATPVMSGAQCAGTDRIYSATKLRNFQIEELRVRREDEKKEGSLKKRFHSKLRSPEFGVDPFTSTSASL